MHVGFVSLEPPVEGLGGIATYLRSIIPAYLDAGHRVTVVAKSVRGEVDADMREGLRLVLVPLPDLHWYAHRALPIDRSSVLPLREVEWALGFYRAVMKAHSQDPFDVIEANETASELLAYRPPAPVVIRLHGSEYYFRRHTGEKLTLGVRVTHRLQLAGFRRARLLTAPSNYHAAMVARELGPTAPLPMVIPNPLPPELLARLSQPRPEKRSGLPTILSVGRLSTVKGTEHLLQALNETVFPSLEARMLLAGPWQLDRSPESFGVATGDDPSGPGVHWLGPVPQSELPGLYSASDVFVMPSKYETYGLSVLEAMAAGMPVVASAAGALPELIEDGVTGLLTPAADARALGLQLVRLLQDQELRSRLGANARRHAMELDSHGAADLAVRTLERIAGDTTRSTWTTSKIS